VLVGSIVSSLSRFPVIYSSLVWVGCGLLPFIFVIWDVSFESVITSSRSDARYSRLEHALLGFIFADYHGL
jgi:hypothetical protein